MVAIRWRTRLGSRETAKGAALPCTFAVCTDERRHEARHHTAPRRQTTVRAEATYDALRSQRNSVAGDSEFFSMFEDELGGTRPDCLGGVRPQEVVLRHTLGHAVDICPSVQILVAPVPQMGNQLLEVFRLLDTALPEQVIDVSKISQDSVEEEQADSSSENNVGDSERMQDQIIEERKELEHDLWMYQNE